MIETELKKLTAAIEENTAALKAMVGGQTQACPCEAKEEVPIKEVVPTQAAAPAPVATPPAEVAAPVATPPAQVAAPAPQTSPAAPAPAQQTFNSVGNPMVDAAMQLAATLSSKEGNPAIVMGIAQKHGITDIMTASDESLSRFCEEVQGMLGVVG